MKQDRDPDCRIQRVLLRNLYSLIMETHLLMTLEIELLIKWVMF